MQFCGDICQTVTHSCKLHAQVTHVSKSQLLFQPWSLRLLQNYFLKCSSDVKLFYPEIVQHTADLQLKCTETEKNASLIELLQTPSYRLERNRVRDREIREGREISGEHDNISENFELSIYRMTCAVSYVHSIHHNVLLN